jgi:axin 1
MRTSKSMPDSNMRKFSKWGSINTDSGISLFSSDTLTMKHKDAMSISSSSSSSMTKPQRTQMLPPEAIPSAAHSKMAQQLEDARRFVKRIFIKISLNSNFFLFSRSKRYQQTPPLPQKNVIPPPIPAKNLSQPAQTVTTPAASAVPEQTTTVVYSFCDEDVPYRIKIPGKHPLTLKQFKDYLPKKGNYRYEEIEVGTHESSFNILFYLSQ